MWSKAISSLLILTISFVLFLPFKSFGQDGTLNTSFAPGTGTTNGSVRAMGVQSSGDVIAAGAFTNWDGSTINRIVRLSSSDGSLDGTFNTNIGTGANGAINDLIVLSDDRIVIVGDFTSFDGTTRNRVAILDSDGTLDTGFDLVGTGFDDEILAVAVESDDQILVGGYFTDYNSTAVNGIARLDSDGTLDATFLSVGDGVSDGVTNSIWDIELESDEQIIIAGDFGQYNGNVSSGLARLDTDGAFDATFDVGTGISGGIAPVIYNVALTSGELLVIGGEFTSYNGTTRSNIAMVDIDGSLYTPFNPGSGTDASVNSIVIASDKRIIIGGTFADFDGNPVERLVKINESGNFDNSFDSSTGADSQIDRMLLISDTELLIGGGFQNYQSSNVANRIAVINNSVESLIFYSQSSGAFDLTSRWNTATDGSGMDAVLTDFTDGGSDFVIQSGHSITESSIAANIGNLTVDGSYDATSSSTALDAGNLSISSGGSFQIGNQDVSINGNAIVSGTLDDGQTTGSITFNGTLTVESTGSFAVTGLNTSFFYFHGNIVNRGTFNLTNSTQWYIEGDLTIDNQTATDMNFAQSNSGVGNINANLTLTSTDDGNINLYSNSYIRVANGITVRNEIGDYSSGTGYLRMTEIRPLTGTITLENGANARLMYAGGGTYDSGVSFDFTETDNEVIFSSVVGTQELLGIYFYHLTIINGTTTNNLQGNTIIAGNLTIGSLPIIDANNFDLTIGGNLNNNNGIAGFVPGTGTVTLNGSGTTTQNVFGSTDFYNLIIDHTGSSGQVTIAGDFTVSNQLTLTSGSINLSTSSTIGFLASSQSISGTFSSTRMIKLTDATSIVRKYYDAIGSYDFPIGTTGAFSPSTITLSSGTTFESTTGTRYVEVSAIATEEPNVLNSGLSLTKYWTVNSVNLSNLTGTLDFTYTDSEIVGTETNYISGYYNGSWNTSSGVTPASNLTSFALSGLSSLNGNYTAGEIQAFDSEPIVQATDITFSNINATQFDISWTNGDGSDRIVVVKEGSAVDASPVDANTYIGNSIFQSGDELGTGNYIVYNGTGNSVTVTGLTQGTTYHVQVFEYNGTVGIENYNTSIDTGNPASQLTNESNGLPPGLTGLFLDGTNDYVEVSGSENDLVFAGTSPYTVEAWIKITGTLTAENHIVGKYDYVNYTPSTWRLFVEPDGTLTTFRNLGIAASHTLKSPSPLPLREWVHVASSYDGTTLRLFINGSEVSSAIMGSQGGSGTRPNLIIGSIYNNGNASAFFPGQIDEIKIWDVTRSLAEIQADMFATSPSDGNLVGYWSFDDDLTAGNQTTASDGSGNGLNGTLTNGALWSHRVINTLDNGEGSLRDAIIRSNTDTDTDYLDFSIPNTDANYILDNGNESWTIYPTSDLTSITQGAILDATVQPGLGDYRIRIDGQNVRDKGLRIAGGYAEIYGFYITQFSQFSSSAAIYIQHIGGSPSTIGGIDKGNVLNSSQNGISILNRGGCTIQGNLIGTDETGEIDMGNVTGLSFGAGGANNQIVGGSSLGEGNIISGNINGIGVNASSGHIIEGNYIGTNIDGTLAIPNNHGIGLGTNSNNQVLGNIISGNTGSAIRLSFTSGNTIQSNIIGEASDGSPLGNNRGIEAFNTQAVSNNTITQNTIANNTNEAIVFINALSVNNQITENLMSCNGTAIELNDLANNNIQPPIIQSKTTTSVSGTGVNGDDIHLYKDNTGCTTVQSNEYLGTTTVDGSGNWSVTGLSINVGTDNLSATASNSTDGTSELSILAVRPFITTWNTTDNIINIPTTGGGYNYDIYWEEVGDPTHFGSLSGQTGSVALDVDFGGNYRVEITGDFPQIYFNNTGDKNDLLTIEQWGDISWQSMNNAFYGCSNLIVNASDAPDLSLVTDLSGMFRNASSLNHDISAWDVSNVLTMNSMFSGATAFNNGDSPFVWTTGTGTANVQNMTNMFANTSGFNQDISSWDVGSVTTMQGMFGLATAFNNGGVALNWGTGTSIVSNMIQMFYGASAFNQEVSFEVGGVTDATQMFAQATTFNQNLSTWDVSAVINMGGMFEDALAFDQSLGDWNVSLVAVMTNMLNNTGLSISNYDATLIGWAGQTLIPNVTLGASGLYYCSGETAHDLLTTTPNNWTISDAGLRCIPTIQATDIIIESPFSSAIDIFWTNGNGANRIVVVHAGSAVDTDPSDNTTYTANTTFGSGSQIGVGNYVVYNGNGASVRVTGISSSTNYHVRVYEYNGTAGAEIYNINTATGNPAESLINGINSCNYNALVALYNATDGPNWSNNTGWLTATPVTDWYGINTSGGRVTSVSLDGNNLVGTLPSEVGCLSAAQTFSLSDNQISGTIPPEIGNLTGSFYIRLRGNQLSGSIPPELGNLRTIQLWLQDNDLTGSIPVELGNINQLSELRLDRNQLTGSIPAELGNPPNLWLLFLYDNQLTGTIPITDTNFPSLQGFDVGNNQLSGSIPVSMGHSNHIELDLIGLSNNQLSGTIPVEIGNLSNLLNLQLDNNQLTGTIPLELGNLTNLTNLELQVNQLSGSIPDEIGNMTSLILIDLDFNDLTGQIPTTIGALVNLEDFDLNHNQITGPIPTEIGNLTQLRRIDFNNNLLNGNIPIEMQNLVNLETLIINNNQLTGSLPAELGDLTAVTNFDFHNNLLTGTIPSTLGNLTLATKIHLQDNQLTGAVPASFSNLTLMQDLGLHRNQLDDLPDLSGLLLTTSTRLEENSFEFDDLEPNVGLGGVVYSPQANLVGPGDQALVEGGTLNVSIPVGGSQNQYQWYKDGSPLSGQTTDNLLISSLVVSDAGSYHIEVINTTVTGLTLISNSFIVTVAPVAAEIDLYLGTDNMGTAIIDAQVTPIDFGTAALGTDITLTFAIDNPGLNDLMISSISLTGTDFNILNPLTTVSATSTETFDIMLSGVNSGTFNDVVTIVSDDSDENPFTFPITGTISGNTNNQEITITFNGSPLISGTGSIDFGSGELCTDVTQTINIENSGTDDLIISDIQLMDGSVFTLPNLSFPITLASGQSLVLNIIMNSCDAGSFEEQLTIVSNDLDEGAFQVALTGVVVDNSSVNIVDGNTNEVIITGQDINLGQTFINVQVDKNFGIENLSSTDVLQILSITVDNPVFVIINAPTTVAPGGREEFTVRLLSNTAGIYSGTVTVTTNINNFSFGVTGVVVDEGDPPITIYNIVTPNGDGIHDFFKIVNIEAYPSSVVSIFDRWGSRVFETTNYNNTANFFMGISDNGDELITGNYYYVIDKGNGDKPERGFILLKR